MTKNNNNFISTAKVYSENKYSEFTTTFRIPFKETSYEEVYGNREGAWKNLLNSWAPVCIKALEMRMDSCINMLFRNRNNVLISNESQVIFKKSNGQIHAFNHFSFRAMETIIVDFQEGNWERVVENKIGIRQTLKALYWVSEENRQDHGGFGFGQLISCLEEFTL
jgi:hypothetical protein